MRPGDYQARIKRAGLAAYWLRHSLSRFPNRVPSGGIVLDIGGGDSPYRDLWKSARLFSIDLCHPEADAFGNILSLPIRSASADLAVCTEVLEHVFETGAALKELHRILKPGGWLLLSTPLVMGRHEVRDFYRFTPECLERHLASAGFEQIEIHPRGGIFSSIGLFLTHIPEQILSRKASGGTHAAGAAAAAGIPGRLWFLCAMAVQKALRIMVFLDRMDARRDFTLGYTAASIKRKPNDPA